MTLEEVTAKLSEAETSIEALAGKNKELLGELKTERKTNRTNDVDSDKYYKLKDEFDDLQESYKALEHTTKGKDKDITKLTELNTGLNANLQSVLIDGGLSDNLAKIGVKPEFLEATRALLRGQVSIVDNKAIAGDKPLNDFMTEWAGDAGKAFISAPQNSGSGGQGGSGGESAKTLSKMSESERNTM